MGEEVPAMATEIAIDPALPDRALPTGDENATAAKTLGESIDRRAQARILESLHKFDDWDPDYDYKEERRRRDRKLGFFD